MNATAKYLFDTDFGPGKKVSTTIALADHAALVAEAETRGYRNGFQAAEAEMKAETARRLAIALEQAAEMLDAHGAGLEGDRCAARSSKPSRLPMRLQQSSRRR